MFPVRPGFFFPPSSVAVFPAPLFGKPHSQSLRPLPRPIFTISPPFLIPTRFTPVGSFFPRPGVGRFIILARPFENDLLYSLRVCPGMGVLFRFNRPSCDFGSSWCEDMAGRLLRAWWGWCGTVTGVVWARGKARVHGGCQKWCDMMRVR